MVIRLAGMEGSQRTGLKARETIQTRVESTDDTNGMEMEARGWMLETP